jgi:hypothetical protein
MRQPPLYANTCGALPRLRGRLGRDPEKLPRLAMARSGKAGRGCGKHSETARIDLARPAAVTPHGADRFGLALVLRSFSEGGSEATLHGYRR